MKKEEILEYIITFTILFVLVLWAITVFLAVLCVVKDTFF